LPLRHTRSREDIVSNTHQEADKTSDNSNNELRNLDHGDVSLPPDANLEEGREEGKGRDKER
jgi:hypothetical protein